MFDDLKKNIDVGKNGVNYTYGYDKSGQMYIYDTFNNKMVYYGDRKAGANKLVDISIAGDRTTFEGDQAAKAPTTPTKTTSPVVTGGAPAKVLDRAGLNSIDSLLQSYDTIKNQGIQKAAIKRDTAKAEKEREKKNEESKYQGKKLSTLQDFSGAKTDTDINTRNTLENLVSSLSTLGLGGSRALTRQILDNANMSNRKANATQAKDNQGLDASWNEYAAGNDNDLKKINDQYGFDEGEANRTYLQNKQTALYKKADIYGNGGDDASREAVMNEGNSLNSMIAGSAFMNPSYTGETKAMATPELGDYTQDIAKYDTTNIGNVTPVGTDGAPGAAPGNLAIKAIAVNDKDLGIKKKTEAELGYGV